MFDTRLASPLLQLSQHPRLLPAADIAVKAAALLALMLLVAGYLTLPTMPVFGHDEAHYYSDYTAQLLDDGRWLNFLLHRYLRSVPLPIWSVLYLTLSWAVFYRLSRNLAFDAPYAALVASTVVLSYPFLDISLWPATMVPAVALVLLAVEMQARGVGYQVVYLTSGVLIFGSMQTLYFVLPLLFLPQFLDPGMPARAKWWLLLKHMCWWVAGSVAGILVMSLMLRISVDVWFPRPAVWRQTSPVQDLASLLQNIAYVSDRFVVLMGGLLRLGGVTLGFVLVAAAAALVRIRTLKTQVPALLLVVAVLISFFLFCVPHAPVILPRSLIAMAGGTVMLFAIIPGQSAFGRLLGAALLLKMSYSYSMLSQDYLEQHKAETTVFVGKLRELFPGYPMTHKTLALYGTMDPSQPEARRFNDPSLMHPMLITLGVEDYRDCRIANRCDGIQDTGGPALSVVAFANGYLELTMDAAGIAIIRYRE